jgi:hypothetical protein
MKLSLRTGFAALALTLSSSMALAGVCEISVTRVACPGKEADSFKKCDGKPSCVVKKKSDSAEDCAKAAADECPNSRLDITKSKEITAKFGGAAVKSKDGKEQFCAADRPDFNKCK